MLRKPPVFAWSLTGQVMDPTLDSRASTTVEAYARVINYATAKAYRKWRGYMIPQGSRAPFDGDDIRQYATEAVLVLAGCIPGRRHSIAGKLTDVEAQGGERYVQRVVDMYVSACLTHEAERARAVKRGRGADVLSLDHEEEKRREEGFEGDTVAVETSPTALTGISERFPVLYLTEVEGLTAAQAMAALGLTVARYRKRRRAEVEGFRAWAYANRRVAA